jgi:hypothetical protein
MLSSFESAQPIYPQEEILSVPKRRKIQLSQPGGGLAPREVAQRANSPLPTITIERQPKQRSTCSTKRATATQPRVLDAVQMIDLRDSQGVLRVTYPVYPDGAIFSYRKDIMEGQHSEMVAPTFDNDCVSCDEDLQCAHERCREALLEASDRLRLDLYVAALRSKICHHWAELCSVSSSVVDVETGTMPSALHCVRMELQHCMKSRHASSHHRKEATITIIKIPKRVLEE